jgi:hypothetical protein
VALSSIGSAAPARAQYTPRNNPYAYDLRIAAFPLAFQAAISQTHFGSALRAEVDLSRRFVLSLSGRLPWLALAGETSTNGYTARATFSFNFVDDVQTEQLAGSVYPEDVPAPLGPRGNIELEGPVSQKLGSPPFEPPDIDREARAAMRNAHSLRIGYDFVRTVERGRPNPLPEETAYFENILHVFHLGYGWAKHWNLRSPSAGKREVGWRRFFLDALLTADPIASSKPIGAARDVMDTEPKFFPLGARIGMDGSIGALLRRTPGLGFGYSLELGALPGTSGVEGYLFVGLGVELDLALRPRRL